MSKLHRLYETYGQSPWLDDLPRSYLLDGTLSRFIEQGIRGVTANPSILAKAIEGSDAYDRQFSQLIAARTSTIDAYWELVIDDARDALRSFRVLFDASDGTDGLVSLEVAPELAHDSKATIEAARALHRSIDQPNLLVKIPATEEGIPAIRTMTAEGYNINVTLIFSLTRYRQVIDAYITGLEDFAKSGGDLTTVHSVASFFVSRVDTEVDRRLKVLNTPEALSMQGKAAVAQAKVAYQVFRATFSSPSWTSLAARGARVQRPLWASTSTKNPSYPDTLYVDQLIGPDTVNTLPETTIALFEDHGTLAQSIDQGIEDAQSTLDHLGGIGIDMDNVGRTLEDQGVQIFHDSSSHVLKTLDAKSQRFSGR